MKLSTIPIATDIAGPVKNVTKDFLALVTTADYTVKS
jgi:hypothetical protein